MKIQSMYDIQSQPEVTTGGRALKFASSVRIDIRRIDTLKQGDKVLGNRVRVKIVKNKVAPPLTQCEFDILYGEGASKDVAVIDLGVNYNIINKSGAWYSYNGTKIGQGKEKAKEFMKENPDIALEIENQIRNIAYGQNLTDTINSLEINDDLLDLQDIE